MQPYRRGGQRAAGRGGVFLADIDLSGSETVRQWWPFLRNRRIDAYEGLTQRFIDGE